MANAQRRDIDLEITRYEYGDMNRKQVGVLQINTNVRADNYLFMFVAVNKDGDVLLLR